MALIKSRLGIEAVRTPGKKGQFDVVADGVTLSTRGGNWLTRSFGLGYPDFEEVVRELEMRASAPAAS